MEKDELKRLLQGKFEAWFERTMIQRPSYEYGESASIRFRVGRDAETGPEDEDYWNASVETTEDVNCDESLNAMRKIIDAPSLPRGFCGCADVNLAAVSADGRCGACGYFVRKDGPGKPCKGLNGQHRFDMLNLTSKGLRTCHDCSAVEVGGENPHRYPDRS